MKLFNFNNTYSSLPKNLYSKLDPDPVKNPELVIYNKELAIKLGINGDNMEKYLSGSNIPDGADPLAQAYAGHQFGQLNILGDGRAILLGEHITPESERFDIQLKGSGLTPYSRSGDGRATLSSMLREYIISFAMDKLRIPTTQSLAVVKTGESVYRENINQGAVLTRVSSSHIRVGTFQYVAMKGDLKLLKTFTDYVINRHYPGLLKVSNPYLELLESVMDRQINLIINWLRVGFIHGVMNTDNVSISGETIDYGPCAFMDIYDPKTVFSSIDRSGRYSFENQKIIGGWNLARFAETLLPLIDSDAEVAMSLVNKILTRYTVIFNERWIKMMALKIGIKNPKKTDIDLINKLLLWMEQNKADFNKTFRSLTSDIFLTLVEKSDNNLKHWYEQWVKRKPDINLMKSYNPAVIPRNHIVEEVLSKACDNNLKPLKTLLKNLSSPYSDIVDDYYKNPPDTVNKCYKTFCGT